MRPLYYALRTKDTWGQTRHKPHITRRDLGLTEQVNAVAHMYKMCLPIYLSISRSTGSTDLSIHRCLSIQTGSRHGWVPPKTLVTTVSTYIQGPEMAHTFVHNGAEMGSGRHRVTLPHSPAASSNSASLPGRVDQVASSLLAVPRLLRAS